MEKVLDRNTGAVYARKTLVTRTVRHQRRQRNIFGNELRSLRSLGTHAHIVSVFATYTLKEELGLILQPVAETDLAETLLTYVEAKQNSDTLHLKPITSVLERAFGCLVDGLAFIHQKNIRHKDIKPENILVHDGVVVYTDFGSSYLAGPLEGSSTTGPPGGVTWRYCAPEVGGTSPRNSKSDVYSLGCVFIEILFALTLGISCNKTRSFSKEMEMLHEQLGNIRIPCYLEINLLPGIIKSMTSLSVQDRPTANDLCCDILCESAFGCARCRSRLEAYQKIRDERRDDTKIAKTPKIAEGSNVKTLASKATSKPSDKAPTAVATQKTSSREITPSEDVAKWSRSRPVAREEPRQRNQQQSYQQTSSDHSDESQRAAPRYNKHDQQVAVQYGEHGPDVHSYRKQHNQTNMPSRSQYVYNPYRPYRDEDDEPKGSSYPTGSSPPAQPTIDDNQDDIEPHSTRSSPPVQLTIDDNQDDIEPHSTQSPPPAQPITNQDRDDAIPNSQVSWVRTAAGELVRTIVIGGVIKTFDVLRSSYNLISTPTSILLNSSSNISGPWTEPVNNSISGLTSYQSIPHTSDTSSTAYTEASPYQSNNNSTESSNGASTLSTSLDGESTPTKAIQWVWSAEYEDYYRVEYDEGGEYFLVLFWNPTNHNARYTAMPLV